MKRALGLIIMILISHIMCSTIISNGIWGIEPQSDRVWYVMQVDEELRR